MKLFTVNPSRFGRAGRLFSLAREPPASRFMNGTEIEWRGPSFVVFAHGPHGWSLVLYTAVCLLSGVIIGAVGPGEAWWGQVRAGVITAVYEFSLDSSSE